jgi:hypothetical protein
VEVQLGSVVRKENQPVFGNVLRSRHADIPRDGQTSVWLRTPPGTFAVRTLVVDKFEPQQVNPASGDTRILGAKVTYRWSLTKGK